MKLAAPLAAAAIALAAAAPALAESTVVESRAKLQALLAEDDRSAGRQVSSAAAPGLFGSLFGAEISFGAADPARVEPSANGRPHRLGGRFGVNR